METRVAVVAGSAVVTVSVVTVEAVVTGVLVATGAAVVHSYSNHYICYNLQLFQRLQKTILWIKIIAL